jgi:hypothetical protein
MEEKKCSKCEIIKPITLFYKRGKGYKSHCKECSSIYGKKHYQQNKETHREKMAEHYLLNKDIYRQNNQKYRKDNKLKIMKDANDYVKRKRSEDLLFKLKHNIRSRVKEYLKTKNITTKNRTFDFVCCTPQELKEHLEKKFISGMSWDNYGLYGWHIDHIIPLSYAKNEEELYKLCHFTNLQPMWAIENIKKGSKIIQ